MYQQRIEGTDATMTRGLLVIASAGLVALGIPLSGMSSAMGTSAGHFLNQIGVTSSPSLSQRVEKELGAANQAGILAETAVVQGKQKAAFSEAHQLVRDMVRVKTTWRQDHVPATTLMTEDLSTTMNTVLGLKQDLETVGWVGTGSLVRSLTASWSTGASLLRISGVKSLGTTSYSTVLPAPTVTTVTTMPSSTVATTAPLVEASSTSKASEKSSKSDKGHGDKGHGKQNRWGRGPTHPGHQSKHHQHGH